MKIMIMIVEKVGKEGHGDCNHDHGAGSLWAALSSFFISRMVIMFIIVEVVVM